MATDLFCEDYLVIENQAEADYVVDYVVNGGDKAAFLAKFKDAMSEGFDLDVHLKKVGLANQTTMYKREIKEIGCTFEKAMLKKHGPAELANHYAGFDTICDATQERLDAVTELIEGKAGEIDFVRVVSGLDSSNTAYLKEIPEKYGVSAYHIDREDRIGADNTLTHREHDGTMMKLENFLKEGKLNIGVASGASTPDKCMEDALERIFLIHKPL